MGSSAQSGIFPIITRQHRVEEEEEEEGKGELVWGKRGKGGMQVVLNGGEGGDGGGR